MIRGFAIGLLALTGLAATAQAAQQTLVGGQFDVIYDDQTLGLFGTPILAGNVLFFTPNGFSAHSENGQQFVTRNSTASGLQLVAKGGYQFGTISLAEAGDYRLVGPGSTVDVDGRLIAFDVANSLQTYTPVALAVSAPPTLADGALHDWLAAASVGALSTSKPLLPILSPLTGWLADSERVGLTIENLLTAYTAAGVDPSLAFVEKKFQGVQVVVSMVPEPSTWAAMLAGLALVGLRLQRRGGRS